MKTKIVLSLVLLIPAMLFFNSINAINPEQVSSQTFNPGKKLLITAMHSGFDPTNNCATEFNSYALLRDTLRFTGWHRYGCWFNGDAVFGDSSVIAAGIAGTLTQNNQHDLRTIFDRPITRYFSYGQRSDYQCEQISTGADYYFHSYDTSVTNTYVSDVTDNNFNGGGAKVKFCSLNASEAPVWAGYIVKGLRSNREQCNRIIGHTRDDIYPWYVKPRIRIDTAFANNVSNGNIKVCRIEILNWNGDTVKKVDLRVRNFKEISNRYDGNYIDDFIYQSGDSNLTLQSTQLCPDPIKNAFNWDIPIGVDFRVYWYGNCEMWIDYVRVENEPANQLLNSSNILHNYIINRLTSEINLASANYNPSDPIPNNFYTEEFEFNMTPTIQRLSNMIDSVSQGRLTFMVNLNMDMYNVHIPQYWLHTFNASEFKKYLFDNSKIGVVLPNPYFLEGWEKNDPLAGSNRESYSPNTLPVYTDHPEWNTYDSIHGLLSYPISPPKYDDTLQFNLDDRNFTYDFKKVMKISDELSKIAPVDVIDLHQSHMWNQYGHKLKEPTNEELEVTANIALTYGAKGFMYFGYDGYCEGNGYSTTYHSSNENPPRYSTGFVDKNKNVRDINAYGQNKWSFYKRYNRLLEKWEPYIMSFDNTNRKSFIYRIASERNEMISSTFSKELKAYPPVEFAPDPIPDFTGLTPETNDNAYLQAAFFQKENETEHSKYFMIVNRRCSPFINYSSVNNYGGRRLITMKVNPAYLTGFNNWKIINLETGDTSLTFDKNDTTKSVFAGDFMPGEGRLFKLAPVMQEGGTLIANEECGGEFDCKGEVNNNGKNITLLAGTTINFTNTSARINMEGGKLISGFSQTESSAPVYLKGKSNFWRGLSLNGCDSVLLLRTYFRDISPYPVDSTYALDMLNCKFINVNSCNFLSELDIKSGCIRSSYVTNEEAEFNAFIQNSYFEIDAGEVPAVSFISTAGLSFPLLIEGNTFQTTTTFGVSNAIFLNNIHGGAIKENNISDFTNSVIMLASSMDFYRNDIISGIEGSSGLQVYAMSNAGLHESGIYYTSGYNHITNTGEGSKNIDLDESYFNIYSGFNTFNVSDSEYHFTGTMTPPTKGIQNGNMNCFKFNGYDASANISLINYGTGLPVSFNFIPYVCGVDMPEEFLVFDLGNGVDDTIYYQSGGSGGGRSGKSHEHKSIETITLKDLEDSVSINLRKRNYPRVSELCYDILTNHLDSIDNPGIVSKLYLSLLRQENVQTNISDLKSFLELLILNNPESEPLVKQSYYTIQKCKVTLGLYESALTGFQEIIEQNPYSYEGLVASWDYAATNLINSGGSSGGYSATNEYTYSPDEENFIDDPNDKFDKKSFNKDDRKNIRRNIYNSLKSGRDRENEKTKFLETKMQEGIASGSDKLELERRKTIQQVVKIKRPINLQQHLFDVNKDIQQVFRLNGSSLKSDMRLEIPSEYSLSQNYPNPFNPVTKINYSLPAASYVKITVYDMLGREIHRLVNNEFKSSGNYTVEFNGSNLSSGVYFYRIEAGDFVQTKRMVLMK